MHRHVQTNKQTNVYKIDFFIVLGVQPLHISNTNRDAFLLLLDRFHWTKLKWRRNEECRFFPFHICFFVNSYIQWNFVHSLRQKKWIVRIRKSDIKKKNEIRPILLLFICIERQRSRKTGVWDCSSNISFFLLFSFIIINYHLISALEIH